VFNIQGGRRDPNVGVQAVSFIKGVMESPIEELNGFQIPAEVKVGLSWAQLMSVEEYQNGRISESAVG
jgi:hypothetical protein